MKHHPLAALALLAAATGSIAAPVTAPVAVAAPHDRLLPLQGGRNFRDLGGYRTADGRTVKWGLLFRSGSMHGLTDADYRTLESRNIRTVCDFRDHNERTTEPVNWPATKAPTVLSEDYTLDMRGMIKGDPRQWSGEQARTNMAATYPLLLKQFNGQYRRMFAELLAGHAPLAFNCSAGKDRTGIAAALLLTALGVPRQSVIEDYALTNRYLDTADMLAKTKVNNPASPMMGMPPEVQKAMMAADPHYIEAALAVVDGHAGGADGYFRDELGLSPADLKTLRGLYLERA